MSGRKLLSNITCPKCIPILHWIVSFSLIFVDNAFWISNADDNAFEGSVNIDKKESPIFFIIIPSLFLFIILEIISS